MKVECLSSMFSGVRFTVVFTCSIILPPYHPIRSSCLLSVILVNVAAFGNAISFALRSFFERRSDELFSTSIFIKLYLNVHQNTSIARGKRDKNGN
jgi:hypothetical protein